ncbi:hypothetical protein KP509_10G084400 [Ceratopteris richardii]|nr:hypothetical protein KP509_10G084400 [Ceratopteris richardii]
MNPVSTTSARRTFLNPNAREFVPTSLRSSYPATATAVGDETEVSTASDNGKTFSEKTVSSDTCLSDEESRRYWNAQLPDDILTPDIEPLVPDPEDNKETGSSISNTFDSGLLSGVRELTDCVADNLLWDQSTRVSGKQAHVSSHVAEHDFSARCNVPMQLWEGEHGFSPSRTINNSDLRGQFSCSGNGGNGSLYPSAFGQAAAMEHNTMGAVSVLFNEFPNVPRHTVLDIYQAKGADINLTAQALYEIKLRDETSPWLNMSSPSQFIPNSRPLDMSASSMPELVSGFSHCLEDVDRQNPGLPRLMRKNPQWSHYQHGTQRVSLHTSGLSSKNFYPNFFDGEISEDRFEFPHMHRKHQMPPRNWLESVDALEGLSSELKEEASNHLHMEDFYNEQACQAFFAGNKVLAREASMKGQFHNRLMKAARSKAAEIDMQR